jgi:hypothetical protein
MMQSRGEGLKVIMRGVDPFLPWREGYPWEAARFLATREENPAMVTIR